VAAWLGLWVGAKSAAWAGLVTLAAGPSTSTTARGIP